MKIAFVSLMRAFPWGGSEELWFRAAKLALANGHTVCTLTQRWDKAPPQLDTLRQLGAETYFYEAAQPSLLEKVAIKLAIRPGRSEQVPEVPADVYVLSNGSTWDLIYNKQITDKLLSWNKPYVFISQHNFENGHLISQEQQAYAQQVLAKAEKSFFVSARNVAAAERQLGAAISKVQVLSNPVTIKTRAIKEYPASDALLMACVARLDCAFKGQDLLLQALGMAQWKPRNFHLKLYGSGPHHQHLQQLIALYALHNKVSLEGQVADIDYVWKNNQVLILPSLSEGTPLALIEAMLSGRAAVATDVGGNADYVRHQETGFLAATASVSCLAASLEDLWAAKHKLKLMGEAAFHHAAAITEFYPEKLLLKVVQQIE